MRKLPIYLFFILILAMFTTANPNWHTWGNNGMSTKASSFTFNETEIFCLFGLCYPTGTIENPALGDDAILFGSNLPSGTTDLTEYILQTTISRPPVVVDLGNTGSNEIVFVSGTSLLFYTPTLELIASVSHTDLLSNPIVMNYENDIDLEVVVCEDTDIMIYGITDGIVTLEQEWENKCSDVGTNTIYGDLTLNFENFDLGNEIFSVWNGQTLRLIRTNINNGTRHGQQAQAGSDVQRCSSDFGNAFFVDDIDQDGVPEYVALTTGATQTKITSFNIDSNDIILNIGLTGGQAKNDSCNIALAQIGGTGTFKEIVSQHYALNLNRSDVYIHDKTGTQLNSLGLTSANLTYPSVANFNGNADNNYFFGTGTSLLFKNPLHTTILTLNYTSTYVDSERHNYVSIGEYTEELPYLEILDRDGIYEIRNVAGGTGELHQIYSFSSAFDSVNNQVYPVSLQSSTSFTKDILVYEDDFMATYLDNVISAVCGNGIPESGENTLNCPEDTLPVPPDAFFGYCSQIISNPALETEEGSIPQWINGTRVQTKVTAKSTDNASNVRARMFLYDGEVDNQWDSGWSEFGPHGTEFVFETFANVTTTSSNIRIVCQNQATQSSQETEIFPFSVALDGIGFGDLVSTWENDEFVFVESGEPSENENIFKTAIDNISPNQFGIGYVGVWLLFMLAVAGFVILLAGMLKWGVTPTMFLLVILEVLMIIMGALVGFIPAGVLITLVLLSIAITIVFIRKEGVGG